MNATTTQRRVIDLTFSRDFESLLIQSTTEHSSLTHDLEYAVQRGLDLLQELEDVRDIKHVEYVSRLISYTNQLSLMESNYFTHWKIAVSEDLLDEIDLVVLTHGSDLTELGLREATPAITMILLAIAGCQPRLDIDVVSETDV